IPEIAELLLAKIEGRLRSTESDYIDEQSPIGGEQTVDLGGSTLMLPEEEPDGLAKERSELPEPETAALPDDGTSALPDAGLGPQGESSSALPEPRMGATRLDSASPDSGGGAESSASAIEDDDKTVIASLDESVVPPLEDDDKTRISELPD